MSTPDDEKLMRRAIAQAMRGRGGAEPNPMVGCVIAREGAVLAEGFHARFGGPHAEPAALAALAGLGFDARGATVFVTLEPCCHTDKQTPPCVPRLIEAGVARVVFGCNDPSPAVSGKGVSALRAGGITVDGPVLELSCKQLAAPFFRKMRGQRPYVTLKWAQSADGFVSGEAGRRARISNEQSTRAVHALRSRCDGIAVGIGTVLSDDPLLTARGLVAMRPLNRTIFDTNLRLPTSCRLVGTAREAPVRVFCTPNAAGGPRAQALRAAGVEVTPVAPGPDKRPDLAAALKRLAAEGSIHLLVEGGPTLAAALIAANLVDRAWVIRSPRRLQAGVPAAELPADWLSTGTLNLSDDSLTEWLNPASDVFFHADPSADFVLTQADFAGPAKANRTGN
jgi:diaminohydroxyphosphoribosylaminopyrimidine deaminase/5-amino-6-(5-phosphoribosylamino)uracil reductase